jgi:hypothetical protein
LAICLGLFPAIALFFDADEWAEMKLILPQ